MDATQGKPRKRREAHKEAKQETKTLDRNDSAKLS